MPSTGDPEPTSAAAPTAVPTLAPTTASTATPTTVAPTMEEMPKDTAAISMGGAALGGSAETTLLAQQIFPEVPEGSLSWVAYESTLGAGQSLEHDHEFAFIYAKEGQHQFQISQNERTLATGEGGAVSAGESHTHIALDGPSVFWEVRLTAPGSAPAPKLPDATLIFDEGPLELVSEERLAAFVLVQVSTDGETSVHTHPGPELIYQLSGKIDYQNGLIGTRVMGPGELEGIPPRVSVQKRNPYEAEAEFISWFLVDPSQPFASPAAFQTSGDRGENLASPELGARIVGVSSNYGNGDNDSSFGASKALDGNPATAWSSNGDGGDAWLEIELPSETRVTSVGFWSRTMGTSAEIFSFRVINDNGEVLGPFVLESSDKIYYFETDIAGKSLRFEAVDTSGGNTGAMAIEVFGEPVP